MISERDYNMLITSMKLGTSTQILCLNSLLKKYENFSNENPDLFNKIFYNIIANENLMRSSKGGALLMELAKIENEEIQTKVRENIGDDYDKLVDFVKENKENNSNVFLLNLLENNNYSTSIFFLANKFFKENFTNILPNILIKNLSKDTFDVQYVDTLKFLMKSIADINNILNILFNILHETPENKEKINILINNLMPRLTDEYLGWNSSKLDVIYKLLSFDNQELNKELSKILGDKYIYFINAFKNHKEKQEDFLTLFYEEIKDDVNLVKKFYPQLESIVVADFLTKYPIEQYFHVAPFLSDDDFLSEDEKRFLSIKQLLPYDTTKQYNHFFDFYEMEKTNDYQKFIEHFPIKKFAPFYKNIFSKNIDNLSAKECFFCYSFNKLPYELQQMYKKEFEKIFIAQIKGKYNSHFQNAPQEVLQQTFVREHKTDNMANFKYDQPTRHCHHAEKPDNYTGIWASPKNPNTAFVSLWDEYAQHRVKRNYGLVSTFKISNEAKCLYLENYTDLAKLFFLYPKPNLMYVDSILHAYSFAEGKTNFMYHTFPSIDWDKVLEDYDVIYFAHKPNLNNTKIDRDFYNTEQIMVKDIKFLTDIQTYELDEYKQLFCTPLQPDYKYDKEFFSYCPDYYDEEDMWDDDIEEESIHTSTHTSPHTSTHSNDSHEFNISNEER